MSFPEDPIARYPLGQRVKLAVAFTNAAGAAADPDTAELRYRDPEGTETVVLHASLSNPSVGTWEHGFTLPLDGDKAGAWSYRFSGVSAASSSVNAAAERRFEAIPSPFYPRS